MYVGWGDCGKSPAKTYAYHVEEIEVLEGAQINTDFNSTNFLGGNASKTSIPASILLKDVLNVTRNLLSLTIQPKFGSWMMKIIS